MFVPLGIYILFYNPILIFYSKPKIYDSIMHRLTEFLHKGLHHFRAFVALTALARRIKYDLPQLSAMIVDIVLIELTAIIRFAADVRIRTHCT